MARQTKAEKLLDKEIESAWYRLASGVQVNILDIGTIFAECRTAKLNGGNIDDTIVECIKKYRQN